MTNITVPTLGESVTEATVAQWLKKEGDVVKADEPIVELETDKVTLEVNAPTSGVIGSIKAPEGDTVEVGALLGEIKEGAVSDPAPAGNSDDKEEPKKSNNKEASQEKEQSKSKSAAADVPLSPAVRKMINDHNLNPSDISGSGKEGRITKGDVQDYLKSSSKKSSSSATSTPSNAMPEAKPRDDDPREERVRMSRLRQKIAERLKEAQNTAAMLTTFNEVDMSAVMALRAQYKEAFIKKHETKLGFMSFFTKAAVAALKEFPAVNAEINGTDIIYKNFYDIGVAVSSANGLVVPVIRDADQKSFAEIEASIVDMGTRASQGKLSMAEMQGGSFTITNGGIFGSMLSTPIINPPQSAILGMHNIVQRPVVVNGEIVIRPIMYVALSYDHRIIDGKEAVSFLYRIKQAIEDPQRLILDL